MNNLKPFLIPLILISLLSVNQATLVHKRDTLHILSDYGREVSFLLPNTFKIDSINPGLNHYPCSLSHKGIFFASLSRYPVCPCCPQWAIASPRPFYMPASKDFNCARMLDLKDSTRLIKIDTSKNNAPCLLPTAHGLSTYVFSKVSGTAQITYMLVNVMEEFTDPKKPTISGGGDLGYPERTCINMLVVDMWLQTDGTPNFQGAQLVSTYDKQPKTQSNSTVASLTALSNQHVYDLKGCSISLSKKQKSFDVPQGCYFVKDGPQLKRLVLITR